MESKNWIGGGWSVPSGAEVVVYNPSDVSEEVGVLHLSDKADVLAAEEAAHRAAKEWSGLTGGARAEFLYKIAKALEENLDELATLASREMGKPIGEMRGEVMRGIHLLRYYAGEGVRSNGSVIPPSDVNVLQYTKRVPLGVVGIITPWNFPVAIPIWKIAPALICGNTVIWKPAELASLTATRLTEIIASTGLPNGVLNLVVGKGSKIGDVLLEEVNLQAVSFTGSTSTGRHVAATCAKRNIKFQTEMGGKNAAIILNDANLVKTIPVILSGAFRSAGQKCTATSRIIVESGIYSTFVSQLKEAVASLKVAEALDPAAYLGPVASQDQHKTVKHYVDLAYKEAQVIVETSSNVEKDGFYVNPLVAEGVGADHPLVQEEIFGPVSVLLQAKDFDEAISLSNQTVYGLSAALFTQDLAKGHRFLDEAQAGMVRVNQETAGVEYQAPFGGMKLSSSHTREQGQAALDFYSQTKTCAIKYAF